MAAPVPARAYSVLTHEQIIDLAWKDTIRPLLLRRYPDTTPEQLREAHAYAYGGSAIQDMGYYPFGKEFFSDLTHYVRSGDFVASLFRNAHNVNELAFAAGALSHYLGDNIGHSECINPATGIEFPNLAKKYGPDVTYDESPHGHVRTEFAFDVDQLSHRRLAPAAYLEHEGLAVPRRLVEVAFYETYGLPLHEVLGPEAPALRSYGWSVRHFIPRFAHAESVLHGSHFPKDVEDHSFDTYAREVQKADYQERWAASRHQAGVLTHLLAFAILIMPKIGVLSDVAIRGPNPETEDSYVKSVDHTMAEFRRILDEYRERSDSPLALANRDLDTGDLVRAGAYALTDKTYANLLRRVTTDPSRPVPPGLRRDLLAFYRDPAKPTTNRNDRHALLKTESELRVLHGMPVRPSQKLALSSSSD